MIRSFEDKTPKIAASAWVSEAAYVVGDVEMGEGSSAWPGAVIRGDFAPIRIGSNTHIEDNCVVHCGELLTIGDNVTAGHGVVIHCRSVGDNCLLGNGSILLDGAEIGDFTLVGAGALVLARTRVPEGSFVVGSPAEIRPASEEQLRRLRARRSTTRGYPDMVRRYKRQGL